MFNKEETVLLFNILNRVDPLGLMTQSIKVKLSKSLNAEPQKEVKEVKEVLIKEIKETPVVQDVKELKVFNNISNK